MSKDQRVPPHLKSVVRRNDTGKIIRIDTYEVNNPIFPTEKFDKTFKDFPNWLKVKLN